MSKGRNDDEPDILREIDAVIAQRRRYQALRHDIHATRQLVRQLAQRFERLEANRQRALTMIASFERELAAVPTERLGIDGPRNTEVAAAYWRALLWARDGRGGGELRGPIGAYVREYRLDAAPMSLPAIEAALAQARADLAPHQERLDAALAGWRAEREPAA